ncbi:regulatory LuxR family protein [Serratia fonticola]|uniref:Regulatory LuxR family protein n=1 Tax=Serratia fonticola TaxID=47917 RepID=A0A542BK19_SERFO|nr:LuxR C-terminal-related transcriptional regulator [Serratia fonticola]TQI78932.1 regulatory LuxR family protein [Serratia fonticola]TQI99045.1 regulatory LuxR family protein [Serratia fonticola]TVZ68570.1 regulatory LuxR family protein [Serratia fonticola]
MQNSAYGFGDELDSIMDSEYYMNGTNGAFLDYHDNDIREVSFHISSNNGYFVQGISSSLYKLSQQQGHINFEYTLSDGSARSALLITEMIREKKHRSLMVVIASTALLNILSLSIEHRYRDRVIFIATNDCRIELLTQIADSPNTTWAKREKYFPKGTLSALSNRERRICYYLFRGYTPKMIGTILGINVKTVSSHRVSVMKKIGCANKIGLFKTLQVYYGASVEG